MKSIFGCLHLMAGRTAILAILPLILSAAICSRVSAADKVRLIVEVVQGKTAPAEKKAAPPAKTPPPAGKQGGPPKPSGPDPYTHTTNKALAVSVSNTTAENLQDLSVKCTFLAKAEPKHDTVTEKEIEQKLTLAPGKSEKFTTPEVSFTHTSAHRPPAAPKGQGGKGGGAQGGKAPAMEAASGHSYAGWKVEVYQGGTVVGSASGQN